MSEVSRHYKAHVIRSGPTVQAAELRLQRCASREQLVRPRACSCVAGCRDVQTAQHTQQAAALRRRVQRAHAVLCYRRSTLSRLLQVSMNRNRSPDSRCVGAKTATG